MSLLLAGCPGQTSGEAAQAGSPAPVTDESDPRVVRDSGDLYVAGAPSQPRPETDPTFRDADPSSPGTGSPDETNGTCRLYAPQLRAPTCCPGTYGIDVARLGELCGRSVYLGESIQGSCGYYFFVGEGEPDAWIRGSVLAVVDAKFASEEQDTLIRKRHKLPDFTSTPIPGIDGAFWSTKDGLHWAFLPGWKKPRLITWKDGFCSEEAMLTVLSEIAAAPQPSPEAVRPLVPSTK